jgi:hypothetical protein
MINTDIFLEIGNSHKICEDYIIQGCDPIPYIILSDGCSSSKNTDMGARILCHLAKQYLKFNEIKNIKYYKMGQWVIHNAELTARQLGLNKRCLDATLIVAYLVEDSVVIHMYGDGVIVSKKNDIYTIHQIDFSNNAPYYLSYLIDEASDQLYYEQKNERTVTIITNDDVRQDIYAYDSENVCQFFTEFDCLFIASDGLASFIDNNPTSRATHPIMKVATEFMAFKNIKGEFLKRRMKRALKLYGELGIVHFDDLSIGAFINGDN